MSRLIGLAEVADGAPAAVPGVGPGDHGLMVLRRGDAVFVYANRCPHVGLPLDFRPGRFLDGEGRHILCTNHGARFRIEDGVCISGPCAGERLEAVEVEVRDGVVRRAG